MFTPFNSCPPQFREQGRLQLFVTTFTLGLDQTEVSELTRSYDGGTKVIPDDSPSSMVDRVLFFFQRHHMCITALLSTSLVPINYLS